MSVEALHKIAASTRHWLDFELGLDVSFLCQTLGSCMNLITEAYLQCDILKTFRVYLIKTASCNVPASGKSIKPSFQTTRR